jgi:hypothetical protein
MLLSLTSNVFVGVSKPGLFKDGVLLPFGAFAIGGTFEHNLALLFFVQLGDIFVAKLNRI